VSSTKVFNVVSRGQGRLRPPSPQRSKITAGPSGVMTATPLLENREEPLWGLHQVIFVTCDQCFFDFETKWHFFIIQIFGFNFFILGGSAAHTQGGWQFRQRIPPPHIPGSMYVCMYVCMYVFITSSSIQVGALLLSCFLLLHQLTAPVGLEDNAQGRLGFQAH
jgi:hypothetical protein